MLIGEVEEVTEAFTTHAAQRHGANQDFSAQIDSKLERAVFVSPDKAYIGDEYSQPADDAIHVSGTGVLIQRFFDQDPALFGAAAGGGTPTCKCGTRGVPPLH